MKKRRESEYNNEFSEYMNNDIKSVIRSTPAKKTSKSITHSDRKQLVISKKLQVLQIDPETSTYFTSIVEKALVDAILSGDRIVEEYDDVDLTEENNNLREYL